VPLSKIQTDILRLLAEHRDPESYVAGAAALNRNAPRYSGDIDIFHGREERVASAAAADAETLEAAGYRVRWTRRLPAIYTAEVSKERGSQAVLGSSITTNAEPPRSALPAFTEESGATRLEWVVDSEFRFFPAMPDTTFGYVLHPVDLATNKVMAAAGRREVRDIVDVVMVHETILPLGALVWAAVEKAPGFTPEGLIAEIRRNSSYPASEWRALAGTEPIYPHVVIPKLRAALDDAEAFVSRMPTDKIGLLFFQGGQVVQPEPERLDAYQTHAGQLRGHWPTNLDITTAMFERYRKPSGEPKP
jgi:hypothetical protein